MYELEYVRKRKRRIAVAIVGGISSIVVSSLCIVAFLGRFVGTFTVSLSAGDVKMALSEKHSFANSTTYLRVGSVPRFQEYTYSNFDLIGDEKIDSEETSYDYGGNVSKKDGKVSSLNYLKYTFYVKNTGVNPCAYNFAINYKSNASVSDTERLDNTLRVMLYRDKEDGSGREKIVYGKRSAVAHIDEKGDYDYRSPISTEPDDTINGFYGYAEMFESSEVITAFTVKKIDVNQIMRYTVVFWLEGFRSNEDEKVPEKAKIQIGVKINAYEI